jgi:hypothetical protein
VALTINDQMYETLKAEGYSDNVTAMLLQWQDDQAINGWAAYQAVVIAATSAGAWEDREYEFWQNYTSGGGPSGDAWLLETGTFYWELEDGSGVWLME